MKIGIDIDDTMADTFDYLMPYIAEFFDVDIKYLKDNNISYSNLPKEIWKKDKTLYNQMENKYMYHNFQQELVIKIIKIGVSGQKNCEIKEYEL